MPIYTDLNLSLKKHPGTKDVLKKTDVEAVKTSLRNVLLGNAFDVPFDPNAGGGLRNLLFQLQSPALQTTVKRNIILKVSEYDSRVTIEEINIRSNQNELDIEFKYFVTGIQQIQLMNITLEKTR